MLAYVPLMLLLAPNNLEAVRIRINPTTGEWVFSVAVNAVGQDRQTGQKEVISSLEFAGAPDNFAFFACGWFSYLALAFSAGAMRRGKWKPMLRGLALQTALNVVSLVAYVYINAHGAAINTPGNSSASLWLLKYSYHIVYLVVPFAGPFLIALCVHPEWRGYFTPQP